MSTTRVVPQLAPQQAVLEQRPGGGFVLSSPELLDNPTERLGDWLLCWARRRPEGVALAERRPTGDGWRTLSWADAYARAATIGAGLRQRGLSLERPVMILSGNSLDHAQLMFGGFLAGVPVVPVSVAYSLRSADHAQLRYITELVTPGLVFAEQGPLYAQALAAMPLDGVEVVTSTPIPGHRTTPFSELQATASGNLQKGVGPDTVAKILMTSGSTGRPKGVINTHGMLTANQQALAQVWPWVDEAPPVLVDWLPWSHTFGGNHNLNLVLRTGGTMYLDGGRPAPGLFDETVRNLSEVAPTVQFNVPAGYAMLVQALERDAALRQRFFSRLQALFYAAAALPQATWERLDQLAEQTLGHRVWLTTAWGSTETSPLVTSAHFPSEDAGNIGLPVPGCRLKFVPAGDKLELRVAGPNVTPGYHRQPDLSDAAFDDEGFYRIGDAGRLVDPSDPSRGVRFDGRVAEDFKLSSGTWVNVGRLRTEALGAGGGLLSAAVAAGHDTDAVVLLAWLDPGTAAELAGAAPQAELPCHPAIHAALRQRLAPADGAGASRRVARVLLLASPPDLDAGEITDKGYVNAAAVLRNRAAEVARAIAGDGPDVVSLVG